MRVLCFAVLALFLQLSLAQFLLSVEHGDSSHLKYSITNEDNVERSFLSYGTPFEGNVFFPIFNISSAEGVKYTGPVARRVMPPSHDAFITIPPHSTLSTLVDIREYYHIPKTGRYTVNINIPLFNPSFDEVRLGNDVHKELAQSPEEPEEKESRANSYENCSATEKGQIDSAEVTAQAQSRNAKNCMNGNSCNSLTEKWFGSSSNNNVINYRYDADVFTAVYNELYSDGINAYCNPKGCGPSVYAYVYPTDPKLTVYLCGAFWSQPQERANTIVHEMSHFNVLGGTEDYTYGTASCLALANSNPYEAAHNADNVCYFSAEA